MHNSYFFLKQLVPALQNTLTKAVLNQCYTQNKGELILHFTLANQQAFYIKAYQHPEFSCLSFPKIHTRAKRNSASLFTSLTGCTVSKLTLFNNERAFSISFSNQEVLLFKLFGNQSNLALLQHHKVIELFKTNLKRDYTLDIQQLNRKVSYHYTALETNQLNIRKAFPTLPKELAERLNQILSSTQQAKRAKACEHFFEELNNLPVYLHKTKTGYRLALLRLAPADIPFTNPIEAITHFFESHLKFKSLQQVKKNLRSGLNAKLLKADNYMAKVSKRLKELTQSKTNQLKADLLMANLESIPMGKKHVKLADFYTGEPILVKLNPELSPQKNAERYYRKAKNESKEIAIIRANLHQKTIEIEEIKRKLTQVEQENNLKLLQKMASSVAKVEVEEAVAYKTFYIGDYTVMVGKNARHNDTLTLKIARKNDLWLHAKDVSGSHVVIKQIPGREFPQYVIEQAAQLAAYYSKRKTDSLCPVLFTPKKYVRKKKGIPAGAVMVEREKVILVAPKDWKQP